MPELTDQNVTEIERLRCLHSVRARVWCTERGSLKKPIRMEPNDISVPNGESPTTTNQEERKRKAREEDIWRPKKIKRDKLWNYQPNRAKIEWHFSVEWIWAWRKFNLIIWINFALAIGFATHMQRDDICILSSDSAAFGALCCACRATVIIIIGKWESSIGILQPESAIGCTEIHINHQKRGLEED